MRTGHQSEEDCREGFQKCRTAKEDSTPRGARKSCIFLVFAGPPLCLIPRSAWLACSSLRFSCLESPEPSLKAAARPNKYGSKRNRTASLLDLLGIDSPVSTRHLTLPIPFLQWTTSAQTVNPLGSVQHKIAYDSVKNWVRWDRSGNVERQGVTETIITWTDYNKLVEYVYWPEQGVCEPYGPDAFYEWCFGEKVSQVLSGTSSVLGQGISMWKSKYSETFQYVSANSNCMPLSTSQFGGFTTNFYNSTIGAPDSATWNLPASCKTSAVKRGMTSSQSPFFLIRP